VTARAIRRGGELLKEIEPQPGKRTDLEPDDGAVTRSRAATDAGISQRQSVTALRVASIPEDEFERQVESNTPPTFTAPAEQGTPPNVAQLVPIAIAAARLGVSEKTLRNWLGAGAPQAVRGGRGRGRKAMLDSNAIKAWRAARNGSGGETNTAALEVIAAEVPDILATALWDAFLFVESTTISRRTLAGVLLVAGTKAAIDIRTRIARHAPTVVPEHIGEPEEIGKLARYLKPDQ
jgi:hypothetical protein